jgi:2-oxoacid:acceptor oxidoreductase gamma subunit (pyruvate/2-ketoisovalerate family)
MIEIRFHGRGGQGAVIASKILAYGFFLDGKFSQSFPTFGAERRGAPVAAFVRVDDKYINNRSPIQRPDYVIVMAGKLAETVDVSLGIKSSGVIFINSEQKPEHFHFEDKAKIITFDVNSLALKYRLGTKSMPIINSPILGIFAGFTELLSIEALEKAVKKFVPVKIDSNIEALRDAYNQSKSLLRS